MKRIVPVLIGLTALLTACPQPTTPVDPLTLSYTGTGTATYAPAQATTLTDTFNGVTQNIGTLNPDKSVSITITPDQARAFKPIALGDFKTRNYTSCDTTNLTATVGPAYYRLIRPDYTIDSTSTGYLIAGTRTVETSGLVSWTQFQYWYLNQPGAITGTVNCSGTVITYDMSLKAGWNRVQQTYTYNPTTDTYTNEKFVVLDSANSYSGSWLAYKN